MSNVLEQQRSRKDIADNFETIGSRFERQVAAVPDKLAIVTDEISLTYRALDQRASHIAATLASLPSPRDRPIVLFLRDEAARIAAMLGAAEGEPDFHPACTQFAGEMGELKSSKTLEPRRSSLIVLPARSRSLRPLAAPLL